MASVYLVTNTVNGKQYVGFTTRRVSERWSEHVDPNRGGRVPAIRLAIRKYGPEAFSIAALATGLSTEFALALESAAIRSLGTIAPAGYNLTTGGEGWVPSDETKAKISASNKGKKKSPETRAKLSAAHKGRTLSEATRTRMSAAHKGLARSEEAVLKTANTRLARLAPQRAAALAFIAAGGTQREAARLVGVDWITVIRWVKRAKAAAEGAK